MTQLDPGAYARRSTTSRTPHFHLKGPGVDERHGDRRSRGRSADVTFRTAYYVLLRRAPDLHEGTFTVGNPPPPRRRRPRLAATGGAAAHARRHRRPRPADHAEDRRRQGRQAARGRARTRDGRDRSRRTTPTSSRRASTAKTTVAFVGHADVEGRRSRGRARCAILCDPHALAGMRGSAQSVARSARTRAAQTERPATSQTGPCVATCPCRRARAARGSAPVIPSSSRRSKQRRAIDGETP